MRSDRDMPYDVFTLQAITPWWTDVRPLALSKSVTQSRSGLLSDYFDSGHYVRVVS
tara:strand:- start:454 stop:621 length:168 start_codon:yes stop_codon:yes gene_type:complete